jgi:hypothetical protein
MRLNRFCRTMFTFILLILAALALSSCGKTGMPQPQDPERQFRFKSLTGKPVGKCLAIEAQMEGAVENFEYIRLEFAFMDDKSDCLGCPFVADERAMFSHDQVNFVRETGVLAFSYCPNEAKVYRWRAFGISRYSAIPHVLSNEIYTDMALQGDQQLTMPKLPTPGQQRRTIVIDD